MSTPPLEQLYDIGEEGDEDPEAMPILFEPKYEVDTSDVEDSAEISRRDPMSNTPDIKSELTPPLQQPHHRSPMNSLIMEIDALRTAANAKHNSPSTIGQYSQHCSDIELHNTYLTTANEPQNTPFDLSMPKKKQSQDASNFDQNPNSLRNFSSEPTQNQQSESTGPDSTVTAPESNTDSASSSGDTPEILIDIPPPGSRDENGGADTSTAVTPHMMGGYHVTPTENEMVITKSYVTGPKIPTIPSSGREQAQTAMDTDASAHEGRVVSQVGSPCSVSQCSSPTSPHQLHNGSSSLFTSSSRSGGITTGRPLLGSQSNGEAESGYLVPVPRDAPPILTPQRPVEEDSSAAQQGHLSGVGIVKRYLCQRCLNHGEHWPRKGHKPFCRWSNCYCQLCKMVDERRRLNNAICRQTSGPEDDKPMGDRGKIRNPMCARCSAHGLQNRLRGHKKRCPHANCQCNLCKLVDERRDLMAKQIKLRRQQRSEISRRESSETMAQSLHSNPASLLERRQTFHDFGPNPSFLSPAMGPVLKPPGDPRKFHTGSMPTTPTSGHGGFDTNRLAEALLRQHQLRTEQAGALMARQMEHHQHRPLDPSQQACLSSLLSVNTAGHGGNTAGPPQATVLLPFPVQPSNSVPSPAASGGHTHGTCLGCLEEQLRHELKMAELMRILASNPNCPPLNGLNACHTGGGGIGGHHGHHTHPHPPAPSLPLPPAIDQLSPIDSIASTLSPTGSNRSNSNPGLGTMAPINSAASSASRGSLAFPGNYGSGFPSLSGVGGRSLQNSLLLPTLSQAQTSHTSSSTSALPPTIFPSERENGAPRVHMPVPTTSSLFNGLHPAPLGTSSGPSHALTSLNSALPASHRPPNFHHHTNFNFGNQPFNPTNTAALAALLNRMN